MTSTLLQQLDTYGPDRCVQLDYEQATAYARRLTESHAENFTVVSWFLPRHLRDDFRHVYAFCRWADDLGDETGDRARSAQLLQWWRSEIDACYQDRPRHPVFVALHRTIQRHHLPRKPFDDLVDAFLQDQRVDRYQSWDQVLDYCVRSANPVGRLVLYLFGYRDASRQAFSDATCTALQLANFWQDVRRDVLERDRVYIPVDVACAHGLDIATMVAVLRREAGGTAGDRAPGDRPTNPLGAVGGCCSSEGHQQGIGTRSLANPYRGTLRELVDRTWPLFAQGRSLWPLVPARLRVELQLFTLGGESVLRQIERLDYQTLTHRPRVGRGRKVFLMLRAVVGNLLTLCRVGGDAATPGTESGRG